MIIRITDARTNGYAGSPTWWAQARKSAEMGRAPHGIHQLVLDKRVTHVDVFATEVSAVWQWAEQFEGWVHEGRKQLASEPMESQKSAAVHLPDESLIAFREQRDPR
jgi:hypothetical protein